MRPKSGRLTREKLLDTAEALILDRGYAATSIDQIIDTVGMTKGAFFYHFKTKNHLARALIDRWAAGDRRVLHGNMERAEKLSDDPLQQVLIFAGLAIDLAEQLDRLPQPGCLFATYCFERGLFGPEINDVIRDAMLEWRRVIGVKLHAAAEVRPPRFEVDLASLADLMTVVFEGAFVLSRSVGGRDIFASQLRHYRTYLRLVFDVTPMAPGAPRRER